MQYYKIICSNNLIFYQLPQSNNKRHRHSICCLLNHLAIGIAPTVVWRKNNIKQTP